MKLSLKKILKIIGLYEFVFSLVTSLLDWYTKTKFNVSYYFLKFSKKPKKFRFQGRTYNYLFHRYNTTWRNERAVEVPIIYDLVTANKSKSILEFGNVLSHYLPIDHDVLDKYEVGEKIINEEVVTFKPKKKYDLIVSISTLEHVGWDEYEGGYKRGEKVRKGSPLKTLKALENLTRHLKNKGKIVFTTPLGYNSHLDKLIQSKRLNLTNEMYMKRVSIENDWVEASSKQVLNSKYNYPYPAGNSILIGTVIKQK